MAGPVLGTALEPLELLVERRMLYKLLNIMDNTTHSLRIPLARLHYTHTHLTSHWTDYTTHTHTHTHTHPHTHTHTHTHTPLTFSCHIYQPVLSWPPLPCSPVVYLVFGALPLPGVS